MLNLSHKKLDVYQISLKLVKEVYKATKQFPKEEQFVLISQIRRAAISVSDRDLRSAHGWSRCGSETKGFSEAAARICGYVEIYRGIYVNPPVQRSDLHKSSLPINLQVNPDRSTEIAMEKKTGSPAPAGRRDFSLCKAFRLNGQGFLLC